MLSRVADSIFWMCRYLERVENIARFMDVNYHLDLDLPIMEMPQWEPLVAVTGDTKAFSKRFDTFSQENVVRYLVFDQENPNSLFSCLRAARENARSVREIISSEMWECMNTFFLFVQEEVGRSQVPQFPHAFFEKVKNSCHLFTGLTDVTMSHGEGWHFARMGKLLERADQTTRLLDVKYFILLPQVDYVGTPYDSIQWAAVLKSASGLEMFRKRYRSLTPGQVMEFLLLDAEFPRAVRYCVAKAGQSLQAITGHAHGEPVNEARSAIAGLESELDSTRIDDVMKTGVHEYLDQLQTRLITVGNAISNTFFALRPVPVTSTGASQQTPQ